MSDRIAITFAQLESLVTAAEAGSMTVAASTLHTSQSNVSVAISNLERQLGLELLVRQRAKGVLLTPSGREVLWRAKRILQDARELAEWSRADRGELSGELRLGCFTPLASFFLPRLLKDLSAHAPQLSVQIREDSLDLLCKLVADGDLDAALGYDQQLPAGLEFQQIAAVRPYLIVATGSPWAQRETISLAELVGETMVNYGLPMVVERGRQLFDDLSLPRPRELSTNSIETMRAYVAAGLGFGILNQRWGTNFTADGNEVATVALSDDVAPLRLGMIVRPGNPSAKFTLAYELLTSYTGSG